MFVAERERESRVMFAKEGGRERAREKSSIFPLFQSTDYGHAVAPPSRV